MNAHFVTDFDMFWLQVNHSLVAIEAQSPTLKLILLQTQKYTVAQEM